MFTHRSCWGAWISVNFNCPACPKSRVVSILQHFDSCTKTNLGAIDTFFRQHELFMYADPNLGDVDLQNDIANYIQWRGHDMDNKISIVNINVLQTMTQRRILTQQRCAHVVISLRTNTCLFCIPIQKKWNVFYGKRNNFGVFQATPWGTSWRGNGCTQNSCLTRYPLLHGVCQGKWRIHHVKERKGKGLFQ